MLHQNFGHGFVISSIGISSSSSLLWNPTLTTSLGIWEVVLQNLFSCLHGTFQAPFASSSFAASCQSQVSCLHLLGKVPHQSSLSQVSWSWSGSWSVLFPIIHVFIHMCAPYLPKPGLTARAAPEGRQGVDLSQGSGCREWRLALPGLDLPWLPWF